VRSSEVGPNSGGRPRGDRFKAIAADLKAMVSGIIRSESAPVQPSATTKIPEPPPINMPLNGSPNERARSLLDLDQKFIVDLAAMNPKASAYFRRRPWLTPDVCHKWRMGYLPRDTVDREPEKFHFVKGFHRGIELFGQHAVRSPEAPEKLRTLGLVLVEGPNDVIRLDDLGVPAVALCSNRISREQAEKAARLARELAGGIVTLFLDCDPEGEEGMKQCLGYLAQLCPVQLAWTSNMYGGKFKGRQPESLIVDEWESIQA
jgi:5S rRNA maturation endonuclease (ribonuclease M5)